MSKLQSLGEIAYEAYCDNRNWTAFNGTELPDWDGQKEDLREAWEVAAQAVITEIEARPKHERTGIE